MEVAQTDRRIRPLSERLAQQVRGYINTRGNQVAQDEESAPELARHLMVDALHENATDIHLDPTDDGVLVRLRIDGSVRDACVLPAELGQRLIRHFKVLAQIDPTPLIKPADGRADYQAGERTLDLRIAAAPCITGDAATIRILDPRSVLRQLTELGLSVEQRELIAGWLLDMSGMFLVAGPTGGGKTTTLYALLHELRTRDRVIVAIEDPVEYRLDGINQIQVDERRGLTFEEGLKEVLRLDPDYILIGEMRDRTSARAAVEASANGKIVMSTLHSRDAVGVISSLRNYGVEDHEIIAGLEVVVAQRLVRVLCPNCRQEEAPTEAEASWLRSLDQPVPRKTWHGSGCEQCRGNGYRGRTGVFQVWRLDENSDRLVAAQADEHALRKAMRTHGLRTLLHDGLEKVAAGITSIAELQSLGGQARFIASRPSRSVQRSKAKKSR